MAKRYKPRWKQPEVTPIGANNERGITGGSSVESNEARLLQVNKSDPEYDGFKGRGIPIETNTGTVLGVEVKTPPLYKTVSLVAPHGVEFYCCNKYQQTYEYTTHVVCSVCGNVHQIVLKRVGKARDSESAYLLFAGQVVRVIEDFKESMTTRGFTIPKGYIARVEPDYQILPMDRSQEVLIKFKPSKEEWPKKDVEPPVLTLPVAVRCLEIIKPMKRETDAKKMYEV